MVIEDLLSWLLSQEHELKKSSIKTDCYKWTKWQRDNSAHIFPCVCPTRNKECIFVETYYEVQKAYYLTQKEEKYLRALDQYYKIQHNKNAILEWVKYHEYLGRDILTFNPVIKIKIQQEPYKVKQIVLPKMEIQNLLKFQEIFTECYYSEQYENY